MQPASPSDGFRIRVIFVQIKCVRGQTYAVAADLVDNVAETSEVYSTSGSFDLLAKFTIAGLQDPGLFVTETLQAIAGIADTYTIIGFNAFTPHANPG